MNFDFSEEQHRMREAARRFLAQRATAPRVRAVLDEPAPIDRNLWGELAEAGYLGIAVPEAYGGMGAGYLELCVIAEELGRALAPVPFDSSIILAVELLKAAGSEEQKHAYLPKLVTGESIGTLALAEMPGEPTPGSLQTTFEAGRLSGTKIAVPDGAVADFAIVAARARDDAGARGARAHRTAGPPIELVLVDLQQSGVMREPLKSIDPTRGLARLEFDSVAAKPLGDAGDSWTCLLRVLDRAAVLIAFEQLGGADRALEMARDHALERVAFGRPIGSFQAIKHMLADMYVAATLARSNAYYGAWALSADVKELGAAAAAARVSATQAYQQCARNNIQVHGGMGFTWESDCHLLYRRSNLLALCLGGLSHWEDRLIEQLCAE